MTTAAELVVKVSADTASAEGDLRSFSSRMLGGAGGMGAVFGGTLLTAGVMGATRLVGGLAKGVVGLGADAVQSGMQFEYAMDQVTAVLGGTTEDAQRLNDTALALGMNPNLKVGIDEVAAGMYTLATAGITADQIIGGAMESTILLGNAAGASMDQSAEVTTKAMSIFKLGAGDLGNVVNGAVGVLNASTYSLEDYAYFVANAGGTAAALGLSIDEMNQAAVVMAPSFSTGRTAATSFDAMLKGLSPTTKAAQDAMLELGMVTEDGSNIFFDAAGNVIAFDDIYRELVRTMGGLDAKTQMDMSKAIFGEAGGAAAIALIRTTSDEYSRLQTILGNTNALEQAKLRTENLESKWATFKDTLKTIGDAAYDAVKVPLTMTLEAIMPLVSSLGPTVIGWATEAGDWLTTNIPIIQARIPFALEAWNTAPGLISGLAAAYGELSGKGGELKPVVDDLSAMDAALKAFSATGANPFPVLIAGIVASLGEGETAFDEATGTFTAKWEAFQVDMSQTGEVTVTVNWKFIETTPFGQAMHETFGWIPIVLDALHITQPVTVTPEVKPTQKESMDAALKATFGWIPLVLSALNVKQPVTVTPEVKLTPKESMDKALHETFGWIPLVLQALHITQPVEVTPEPKLAGGEFNLGDWLVENVAIVGAVVQLGVSISNVDWGATWTTLYTAIVAAWVDWGEAWSQIYSTIATVMPDWGATWTTLYGTIASIFPDWGETWSQLYDAAAKIFPNWGTTWTQIYTAVVNLIPNWLGGSGAPPAPPAAPAGGHATGTMSAPGGLTWVGERGPELVALPGASRVWNNRESMAMAGAGGPQVVINASVADALDIESLARRVMQYMRRG